MAVEEQIVALLRAAPAISAAVGSRIYATTAPQHAESPFLTYQFVTSNRTGQTYEATAAYDVTGLQVDCWATDVTDTSSESRGKQVRNLARSVRSALHGQGLTGEDRVDLIRWDSWVDFGSTTEKRRSLDFTLMVRGF